MTTTIEPTPCAVYRHAHGSHTLHRHDGPPSQGYRPGVGPDGELFEGGESHSQGPAARANQHDAEGKGTAASLWSEPGQGDLQRGDDRDARHLPALAEGGTEGQAAATWPAPDG